MFSIEKMTLKEKIGQMIGLAFSGSNYSDELRMQVEEIGAGLIIYFKDNCITPKQIFELNQTINQHAKIAPFIALDQEGGMVARVTSGIVQTPGAMVIGATKNADYAYRLSYDMGVELRHLGFNFNFAPVGDINNNPLNPVINVRSYSEKPEDVAKFSIQAIKGFKDAKMMTSLKHFPGHGDTAVDSHVGLPVVDFDEERIKKVELVPFQRLIDENLPGIMASHVLYKNYDPFFPTTLSHKMIQELLRNKMGFKGLVVTDSLTMDAVFKNFSLEEIVLNGFNSGCDILLLCGARNIEMQKEFFECALRLAEEGKISIDMINASVERILKYKNEYEVGQMATSFEEIASDLENPIRLALAEKVMDEGITLVKDQANLLPIRKNEKIAVVFPIIKVVTLVENEDNTLNSLGDYLPFKVDKYYANINPTTDETSKLLAKLGSYDKIIYCSYNACLNKNQAQLINQINKDKLINIALRTPYDLNVLDVKTYICSYEASVLSFKSLAKILTKEIEAIGQLPVTLK